MSDQATRSDATPRRPDDPPRPDPGQDRVWPDVPPALARLAAWSWRLLVVLGAAGLVLYLLIVLKVIVVPVIVALFLATLLVPLVRWLEARGWKHLTAVVAVFLGAVLLLAGIIAGFIPLIGNELGTLRQRADEGVGEVQRFVASRPFGLSEDDLNRTSTRPASASPRTRPASPRAPSTA
jgi:putative heme transporter